MKLTPAILKNLYSTIYCCHPFTRWKMPLPDEIKFQVISDKAAYGYYVYDEGGEYAHTIQISDAMCGHFSTLLRTLCHEAIHMSRWANARERWNHHDKEFRRRCKLVGDEFGLDSLEL